MRNLHSLLTLVAAAALLSGCVGVAQFSHIEPVSFRPSSTNPGKAVVVTTVLPTFEWKALADAQAYDLAIWKVAEDGSPGDMEYFREDIDGTSHTVTAVLLPGEYFWSVRRSGSGAWSTASFKQVNPLFVSWGSGFPFKIRIEPKDPNRGAEK